MSFPSCLPPLSCLTPLLQTLEVLPRLVQVRALVFRCCVSVLQVLPDVHSVSTRPQQPFLAAGVVASFPPPAHRMSRVGEGALSSLCRFRPRAVPVDVAALCRAWLCRWLALLHLLHHSLVPVALLSAFARTPPALPAMPALSFCRRSCCWWQRRWCGCFAG